MVEEGHHCDHFGEQPIKFALVPTSQIVWIIDLAPLGFASLEELIAIEKLWILS